MDPAYLKQHISDGGSTLIHIEQHSTPTTDSSYRTNSHGLELHMEKYKTFKAQHKANEQMSLASLPVAGGFELYDLWGPFQLKPFYDSITLYIIQNRVLSFRESQHSWGWKRPLELIWSNCPSPVSKEKEVIHRRIFWQTATNHWRLLKKTCLPQLLR